MRRYHHSQNTQHVQHVQHTKNVQKAQLQNAQLQKPSQKTRCERPTLKDNGSNGHVQKSPTKKGHLHQQDLEYFTNHHFSRSFNSLILDDPDDQNQNQNQTSQLNQHMSKKPLNKSPPFNVKQGNCLNHTIDSKVDFFDYEGSDLEFLSDYEIDVASKNEESRSDHEVVNQARKLTHFDLQKGETELHLNDTSSPSKLGPTTSRKPLLKRSSKFFNLSIDSEFVPGPSSPHFVKEPKLAWSPLDEARTPFNKFKRPHKLVSQSPSPNSSSKFKLKVAAASPSKQEKTSKMFKNSTSIRMKSPLKLSMSPPTCSSPPTEFLLQRLGKSPNLHFMSSSSPLAGHCFDDHAFRGYDESPSRPKRRASSNFHVYQDQGERPSSATSKTLSDFNAPSTSRSSISEANKENIPGDVAKSAIKSSFKLVKPLQIAFESAGLIKKNSIPKFSKKVIPDTPMKRQPLMMITKETKKAPEHESFLNQDDSIEVGRNHDGTFLNPNDSTSSYFKLPSSIKSERALTLDLSESPDLDQEIIPETPTKSSSREQKLNLLIDDPSNKPSMRFAGVLENEPCTPISQFPIDSIASSQATLSLPNGARELNSSVQTITNSSSFNHPRDPLLSESKIIAPKDRSDERLVEKFGKSNIKYIGSGNFSVAFECNFQGQKFAIKRNRKPISSYHEKKALLREIDALRALTSFHEGETEVAEGKENLVFFVETWTSQNYFYIMTEFCEGGTLNQFLDDYQNYKLDEFRVWKILIEIMSGLRYIHSKNYLHLDLKPANIFITFDGSLKIGDFGLSAKLPVLEEDFDLEGDRNYIAPELINDKIYTPYADIFSAGLMILEIAANIILPDNGPHWRKLRSGDLSDAGKLSSDNISDFLNHRNFSSITSYNSSLQSVHQTLSTANRNNMNVSRSVPEQSFGSYIKGVGSGAQDKGTSERLIDNIRELVPQGAPEFLLDNSDRLGELVSLMTKPNPFDRPTANDILMRRECVEIEARRKAGATIFEGEFGPNDDD